MRIVHGARHCFNPRTLPVRDFESFNDVINDVVYGHDVITEIIIFLKIMVSRDAMTSVGIMWRDVISRCHVTEHVARYVRN